MFEKKCLDPIVKFMVGSKLNQIIYQPTEGILSIDNMFVLNFKNNNEEYSFHVFCSVRFRNEKEVLLTSADEYFNVDFQQITYDDDKLQNKFEKSLISTRINDMKKFLKDALVVEMITTSYGDLFICFDNGIILEISIDCSYEDYEYYRIINLKKKGKRLIVYFKNRQLCSYGYFY